MTEDWFEDELPWLDPSPHLPPRTERPPAEPRRRVPPRLPLTMPDELPVSDRIPPRNDVALPRRNAAVPAFAHASERRHGETLVLRWTGVVMVLAAVIAALMLIMGDARSESEAIVPPAAQVVIPAADNSATNDLALAVIPDAMYQGKVICLDAAHGGIDRGFRRLGDAAAPAMDEALYTAAYARDLAGQLKTMGFTVVMTRDGDTVRNSQFQDVNRDGRTHQSANTDAEAQRNALIDEMQARIDFCNDARADLLVSLHFDGWNDPGKSGFAIWYSEGREDSAASLRAAQSIERHLGEVLTMSGYTLVDGGVKPESIAVTQGNQLIYDSLFVITGARDGLKTPSRMPGVIVDPLTLSNTDDAQLLASGAGRSAIVIGLAQAIGAYFSESDSGL